MFALQQHHKWAPSEVEGMIPFERDLYVGMLIDHIEETKKK